MKKMVLLCAIILFIIPFILGLLPQNKSYFYSVCVDQCVDEERIFCGIPSREEFIKSSFITCVKIGELRMTLPMIRFDSIAAILH